MLGYKHGKGTVTVSPDKTSQNFSNYGKQVKKPLSITRTYICNYCGFVTHRDINTSINMLQLGLSTVGHTKIHPWGDLPSWEIGVNLSFNGKSIN